MLVWMVSRSPSCGRRNGAPHQVRDVLTELGVTFVARQVAHEPEDGDDITLGLLAAVCEDVIAHGAS
jgi:hypothetical protein